MGYRIKIFLELTVLLYSFVCSLSVLHKGRCAYRMLSAYLGCTFFTEATAVIFIYRYHHNLCVYQVMGPLIFFCSCMYFRAINERLRRYGLMWYILLTGLAISLAGMYYHSLDSLNTGFAQYECICMTALPLYYFYGLHHREIPPAFGRNPHWWIALLFLLFYAGSFLFWGCIEILKAFDPDLTAIRKAYTLLAYLNMVFYFGIGTVLLILKPIQKTQ